MRITDIAVTPIAFPDPPLFNVWGVHGPRALRTVVELRTDRDLVGLAEGHGDGAVVRALEAARTWLIGEDPRNWRRMRARLQSSPQAFGILDVACLDAHGRAVGASVAELLGGSVRPRVEFSAYLFFKEPDPCWPEATTPDGMLAQATWFRETHGFRVLKLKGGVYQPRVEGEALRLMRDRWGRDVELRIDPNAGWSVETATRFLREHEDLDLEYLEDPTWGIEGMARVRQASRTPLSTNMCVIRPEDFPAAVRLGAVDVVLMDHHAGWGGLHGCLEMAATCQALNLGVSMHSNSHLGISLAAMTQLGSVIPNLIYAADTHYPWSPADIVNEPFHFKHGHLAVPSGPGLGVTLDRDKLAEYAELRRAHAEEARDDVEEQRAREPAYLPLRPKF